MEAVSINSQPEYNIGLTAFYINGRRAYFTVRCNDTDGESARNSIWHQFKSMAHNRDIECLITRLN